MTLPWLFIVLTVMSIPEPGLLYPFSLAVEAPEDANYRPETDLDAVGVGAAGFRIA
jgi:hypothetical protein